MFERAKLPAGTIERFGIVIIEQTSLTRRQIVAAAITLPFVSAMPTIAKAAPSRLDRFMVQGRPEIGRSLYKAANILPALDQLGGVRKMRCREPYSGTPGWANYLSLAQAGVKFCFTLMARDLETSLQDLRAFAAAAPGSIWAIEFPNEPDLWPITYNGVTDVKLGFRKGNAPALMAFIKDFKAAIGTDPALRSIPLIASNDFMQAEQAPFTTYGNSHIYPKPNLTAADKLAQFETKVAAGKHAKGVITEWGRTTGGDASNATAPPVTLQQQGELLASDVEAALALSSVQTISIYELFAGGGSTEMNNFGLFNADLTPRPAVAAIKSVIV
ncbi:calcium-binding protein [Novosphingobium sp. BL-8A]|uniref:calcium-binding protein n=1 Tax=Novosphingobium sp. BL-8A TaxID=3127639 RepID=UPI00375745D6